MRQEMEKFLNLCEDYQTTKSAFTAAEQGAKVIVDTVAERIQADRAQTVARMAELEHLIKDGSRPASARRVWELELSQLQARTFGATPDEVAAFDAEMSAAGEAVADLGRLQREIREAISGVETEIKKLRAQTLEDPFSGLRGNWLEGDRKAFAALCQGVGT